uniref:Uncharacterized protein n=1 Tax=Timema cristinae TaxID=61476 RepID=A0A7R9CNX4_TIMCR|nr:unnamed protein product [Timema cristinae]
MGDTSSVKQPVSGGSASVGNMRDGSLLVGLLSVKSCKAIRFHLLVVVMVLLSRFLIRVEGLPWPIDHLALIIAGQTPGVMIASFKLESYSPSFRRFLTRSPRRLLTVSRSLGD